MITRSWGVVTTIRLVSYLQWKTSRNDWYQPKEAAIYRATKYPISVAEFPEETLLSVKFFWHLERGASKGKLLPIGRYLSWFQWALSSGSTLMNDWKALSHWTFSITSQLARNFVPVGPFVMRAAQWHFAWCDISRFLPRCDLWPLMPFYEWHPTCVSLKQIS